MLIFKSRYKNNYKSKFFDRILGKIFFTHCLIIDRQLRYSKKIPIHQTEIMMELVTKNELNYNFAKDIDFFSKIKKNNCSFMIVCRKDYLNFSVSHKFPYPELPYH